MRDSFYTNACSGGNDGAEISSLIAFSPHVLIIGAQKSGTTSLSSLLAMNPALCLSKPKEPNFYTINNSKGDTWYKACFQFPERLLIDASTTYTMCPLSDASLNYKPGRNKLLGVPARIFKANPQTKFIYIIRHPVARMYSNYWHNVKYGYEKKSFRDAISSDPLYMEMSFYARQLEKYLMFFQKEKFLVIKFEDLIQNHLRTLNICEKFIGVAATQATIEGAKKNQGMQYNYFAKKLIHSRFFRRAEQYVPASMKHRMKKLMTDEIPPLSGQEKNELMQLFLEDQELLCEMFGIGYL